MSAVVLLHFSPVEMYPPVMNLLDQVGKLSHADKKWIVVSTAPDASLERFQPNDSRIQVFRFGRSGRYLGRFGRAIGYVRFYIMACFTILRFRPGAILYYETLSSLPVFLCRKLFLMRTLFYIHFHEYISPEEHKMASFWFKWVRKREKSILPFASWVSHTNRNRLDLFLHDEGLAGFPRAYVMPNYPPADWAVSLSDRSIKFPIRVVYAGALSLDTMYVAEFADWVMRQDGKVIWDIYSLHPEEAAISYLSGLKTEHIRLNKPVSYRQMPEMLRRYDVGVILYKGHIPNFIWNVPNKLYEYHINGLDVWFPTIMKACDPLVSEGSFPKIIPVDFENISGFTIDKAIDRSGLVFRINSWFSDISYADLLSQIA
jgi:hypothetical protein